MAIRKVYAEVSKELIFKQRIRNKIYQEIRNGIAL
jgi:hypothetical protein